MVIRKNDYIHIDGTFVNVDDLHCLYVSPRELGIVLVFKDGQTIEVRYDSTEVCRNAWKSAAEYLKEELDGGIFIRPHKTIIVRIDGLRYAEFDMIDYRFILQYKDGRTYIYKYESSKVTYEIYKRLLAMLTDFKIQTDHPIAETRLRADFWANPVTTIDGLIVGEDIPNAAYWAMVDKAFVDANRQKKSKKK